MKNQNENAKAQVSLTIDSDVLDVLKKECEYYDRPLSQMINLILSDYLETKMDDEEVKRLLLGK